MCEPKPIWVNREFKMREIIFLVPFIFVPVIGLNTIETIENYGFPAESHNVTTEDGYILTVHRIPHDNINKNTTRKPIVLFPGIQCSSADFVILGLKSLGLLLARNGFDVWLGNQRGSTHGRHHLVYDPDTNPSQFFNFSFHEIGLFDLPATINYVLNVTGFEKVYYIGYSQGGQILFIMNSLRPEFNNKITMGIGIAPASFTGNTRSFLFKTTTSFYSLMGLAFQTFGIYELMPHSEFLANLARLFCSSPYPGRNICLQTMNLIAGADNLIKPSFVPTALTNFPAGASAKQTLHDAQLGQSHRFCQFDYGKDENFARYGQETPPDYPLSKVTIPTKLYYSDGDFLVDSKDVKKVASQLQNVELKKIAWDRFNHLEFVWSHKAAELCYYDIIKTLKNVQ